MPGMDAGGAAARALSRRAFGHLAAAGGLALVQPTAWAHDGPHTAAGAPQGGAVAARRPVRSLPLQLADGQAGNLATLLRHRVTAVQLFFTGCGDTCLAQGALFAELQQRLQQGGSETRQLSLSIDPLGDDAAGLHRWLRRFGAQPAGWTAGVPAPRHLDAMLAEFRVGSAQQAVQHINRVYLFDQQGRLFWTTGVDPRAAEIAALVARHT